MDFDFPLSGDFAISECSDKEITWLCPIGTPVRAVANGKVFFSGRSPLAIKHFDGYASYYSRIIDVAVEQNQDVVVGQIIGHTRNKLCFSISKDDELIDPLPLLRDITEFHDAHEWTSVIDFINNPLEVTADAFVPIYDMFSGNVIGTLDKDEVVHAISEFRDDKEKWFQIGHNQWVCSKDGIRFRQ